MKWLVITQIDLILLFANRKLLGVFKMIGSHKIEV